MCVCTHHTCDGAVLTTVVAQWWRYNGGTATVTVHQYSGDCTAAAVHVRRCTRNCDGASLFAQLCALQSLLLWVRPAQLSVAPALQSLLMLRSYLMLPMSVVLLMGGRREVSG